jgi:tetratricopeptide (TPR) repeat protein
MNEEPARKLRDLVAQYSVALCDDARRCEALLKDYCPQQEREVFLLTCAVRQRVHTDLLSSKSGEPLEVILKKLSRRLSSQLYLAEDAARWAVESIAVAVGVASEGEVGRLRQAPKPASPQSAPNPAVSPQTQPSAASPPQKVPLTASLPPIQTTPKPATQIPKTRRWGSLLVVLLLLAASTSFALVEFHTPTKILWHEFRILQSLDNDEDWGDLGDLYTIASNNEKAHGCYEIARLLDPSDGEWKGKVEAFSFATTLIEQLGIRDDDWVRSLGVKALVQGFPQTGLSLLEQAYSLEPQDPENLPGSLIVELRANIRDHNLWVRMGDALSALSPAQAQGFYAVARLSGPDSEELAAKVSDLTTALPALRAAGTSDAAWLVSLAGSAYSLGSTAVSRELYQMAGAINPTNPDFSRLREATKAIEENAPRLSTATTVEAWISIGDAYEVVGDAQRAAACYGVARLIAPDESNLLSKPANLTDAVALLKSKNIQDDEWIGDRGDVAVQIGATAEALEIYRWAAEVDPADSEWPAKKALLESLEAEMQKVRNDFREDENWGDLGDIYRLLSLHAQANSCYALARLIEPDDGEWQAKQVASLSSAVSMLQQLEIRDDEWIGGLGDAADALGDPVAARALYALAQEIDPNDSRWQQKEGDVEPPS